MKLASVTDPYVVDLFILGSNDPEWFVVTAPNMNRAADSTLRACRFVVLQFPRARLEPPCAVGQRSYGAYIYRVPTEN